MSHEGHFSYSIPVKAPLNIFSLVFYFKNFPAVSTHLKPTARNTIVSACTLVIVFSRANFTDVKFYCVVIQMIEKESNKRFLHNEAS